MTTSKRNDDVATETPTSTDTPPVEVLAQEPVDAADESADTSAEQADTSAETPSDDATEEITPEPSPGVEEELTETDIPIDYETLQPQVEALLISTDRPLKAAKIAASTETPATKPIKIAVDNLNAFYEEHNRAFRIQQLPDGFQIHTQPQFKPQLTNLHQNKTKIDNKLSPAALETLAIVAYKQPVLRAQIEAVRGVASGEVLRSLMDKQLVKIVGRAEELGRPMLYGTTKSFLQIFGMSTLKDLPKTEELNKP